MEPIAIVKGIALPLTRPDVDTDAIIPKQFLKSIERTGFGKNLFNDWRFVEGDPSRPNADFVLNQPRYQGAQILIAKGTFGIGSSREHAPWALTDYGFRCIVAAAFGDIFYNNSHKNGLLLARIPADAVERLMAEVQEHEGCELTVDLPAQTVGSPAGLSIHFDIPEETKRRVLEGLDDIDITLRHQAEIAAFEERRKSTRPWL
ncbi:MAG: 3-isopropylmalate dehydratase small subunit [SAR324 cluster bacterium]|nr:3-isopropylmalate dehydratase small subunit [SAR324 cluster bacterium]